MIHSFRYYYRKRSLISTLLFGLVFLGFVIFWMRGAWLFMGNFPQTGTDDRGVFSYIGSMFTIVPLFMLGVGLYMTLPTLFKILSPAAVIAGDDQGLSIRGSWFQTHRFAWSDLDYVRYEQRTRFYQNRNNLSSGSYTVEYLMVKPKMGRTVSVDITHLDGTVDDILSDMRKLAPNLDIKDFSV